MDQVSLEPLVVRLVNDPHDAEALGAAYEVGTEDPKLYAEFLEKVGEQTADGAIACHWYNEAASVWSESLADAPATARALMKAIDRDPTQEGPANRLAEMYREKGDSKALIALLERRAKALDPLAAADPALRPAAAAVHRQLGRLWGEAPLSQHPKAIDNYRRAIEFNDQSLSTISSLRELYRADQRAREALPYYAKEQLLLSDPERKIALYLEEAEVQREAGDLPSVVQALRAARELEGGSDASLKQQLGATILERVQLGHVVSPQERELAVQLFIELAEEFPGEHGYSYSACALELAPEHERAVQLVMFYGAELGQDEDVAPRVAEYLRVNPDGVMSDEAQAFVTRVMGAEATEAYLSEGRAQVGSRAIAGPREHAAASPSERRVPTSVATAPAAAPASAERKDLSVVVRLLEEGQTLARKARKHDAAAKYQSALEHDPANAEALAFLQGYLRQTRKFKELREILVNACRGSHGESSAKLEWLREIAMLSEGQLKDLESAVWAWSQISVISPEDEQAGAQLALLLEKAGRWDDLASLLEQRAELITDLEARLVVEKKAAKIHLEKRSDPVAAGTVWARIANLAPDDDAAMQTALSHFQTAKRPDLAAQAITEVVPSVSSEAARAELFAKLGSLRSELGDQEAAGDAYTEAGALSGAVAHFEAAESCYVSAGAWNQAATCVEARLEKATTPEAQAKLLALEADYLGRAGDRDESLVRLERAVDLDPTATDAAAQLEEAYRADNRLEDIVTVLLQRAESTKDRALGISLRKRAAEVQRTELSDIEGSRDTLGLILQDAEDVEALELLANDEVEQGNWAEACHYLHRQAAAEPDVARKTAITLREGAFLATQLADPVGAMERYEFILNTLDPRNQEALRRVADLKEAEENFAGAAKALERLLELQEEPESKLEVANRLADIYEEKLDEPKDAVRLLALVRSQDPEDFSAVQRLASLSERLGDWDALAGYMVELIEVEGDDEEVSQLTRRRAEILDQHLGRGDEALAALKAVADSGDEACRDAFVALGDKLGRRAEVANALLSWYRPLGHSERRDTALRSVFERFLALEDTEQLVSVAEELVRSGGATPEIASKLEELAQKSRHMGALSLAQAFLVKQLTGPARAEELVRQALVLRRAGMDSAQALEHGEQALSSMPPAEVEPLLERLSACADSPEQTVDLYEHQVMRCKDPKDRLRALARAAEVAARAGQLDRARGFFEIALGSSLDAEALELLVNSARECDLAGKEPVVVKLLADVLSAAGQSARDGGKTRSRFLLRAGRLAAFDYKDTSQALAWMGDALIAHVDEDGIRGVLELARELHDMKLADAVFERALSEVFDGPWVRLLLAKRAKLRREELDDIEGASADLKRLHELAPSDQEVTDSLISLYSETKNYAGLVKLYEDLILRCKDKELRAELSRKVAKLWGGELGDPREAADAWRRVLRLVPNDPEATRGLDNAKRGMLNAPAVEDAEETPDADAGRDNSVEQSVAAPEKHEEKGPQIAEAEAAEPPDSEASSLQAARTVDAASEEVAASPIAAELEPAGEADTDTSAGDSETDTVAAGVVSDADADVQTSAGNLVLPEASEDADGEMVGDEDEVPSEEPVASALLASSAAESSSEDGDTLGDEAPPFSPEIDGDSMAEELSAVFRRIEEPFSAPNLDSRVEIDLASNAASTLDVEGSLEESVRSVLATDVRQSSAEIELGEPPTFPVRAAARAQSSEEIDVDIDMGIEPEVAPEPPPPAKKLAPPPRPPNGRSSKAPPPPPRGPSSGPPPPPRRPASNAPVPPPPVREAEADDAMDIEDDELIDRPAT
ncbi:MAG: hypothetical protein SFV15_17100 [Polyangiaceae bacterium]|nr:hypothetical protein [Polyangiaceae bacterium]